jgi:hypothetical protein
MKTQASVEGGLWCGIRQNDLLATEQADATLGRQVARRLVPSVNVVVIVIVVVVIVVVIAAGTDCPRGGRGRRVP